MQNSASMPALDREGHLPRQQEQKTKLIPDERGLLDVPFLVLTVLLVTIGVIMMFSASYARAYADKHNSTYYFARQAVFALVGIGIMLFVSRINYQIWRGVSMIILAGSVFLLILVALFGTDGYGAKRWIQIGIFSFQPSEVAKLAIIMAFASMMSVYRDKMQTVRYGILPYAAILVVICGLTALERHFSGVLIILALGATMMFLGGVEMKWFLIGGTLVGAFAAIYLATMGYASARVTAWR